ncbi:MAG: hypothetical protein ACRDUB_05600 [Mycobacterium sp.]
MFDVLLIALLVVVFVRRTAAAPEIATVRAAFDEMLLDKGLVTDSQLTLIRHGTKGHGVVTASQPTGATREGHREVVLDLMVRKPEGGQFPAHETTLIPATALDRVCPGSIIDAYYRCGDESAVAVCVPPA